MTDGHDAKFAEFHAENPHVYDQLEAIALQVYRSGVPHFGISAIFERLRWISRFETAGDPYKLNNTYRAFYARLLMDRNPCLAEFFELRASVADAPPPMPTEQPELWP